MGELIVMTRPKGDNRRGMPGGGSAQILFFTGVRYMRMPEANPALASVTPPRLPRRPRRGPGKNNDKKSA